MSERAKHLFQFRSTTIAAAATAEAAYHRQRQEYWKGEFTTAIARVRETAAVDVKEFAISGGGTRADVFVNHGDPAAYSRMTEASVKISNHREAAERFETDARTYGTQDRTYELDVADVHFYRLGGAPRAEGD